MHGIEVFELVFSKGQKQVFLAQAVDFVSGESLSALIEKQNILVHGFGL
jgi:hypothetical protein